MVLKADKEFLRQAFTNNTFGAKETDLALRNVLDHSFSYLYRLQRNIIEYEEYFYSTRNQVYNIFQTPTPGTIDDSPEMGDFYLDNSGRVCVNFPVELVHSTQREDYRKTQYHKDKPELLYNTEFYGVEITYEDLIKHDELFHRIPVIIIDNQVLIDFKVKVFDDYFTAILPFNRYFLHSKYYDNANHEYKFIQHEYCVQIINSVNPISKLKKEKEIGFIDFKTNKGMLEDEMNTNAKPFGYLSKGYVINLLNNQYFNESENNKIKELKLYDSKDGIYFATIFYGEEKLGTTLIDVDITSEGIQLNLDKNTETLINNNNQEFTIRLIFYRYLHKHQTTSEKYFLDTHEVNDDTVFDYDKKAWSDMFLIRKNENEFNCFPETYEMPVPSENLIVFRVKGKDYSNDGINTWSLIPNEKVVPYYPNMYQVQNETEIIYVNEHTGFYYKENGEYYNDHDEHIFTEDVTTEELASIIENKKLVKKTRFCLRNIEPDDKVRVYYFYHPGYDLNYSHMYEFFYKYLYYKWGKGFDSENGYNIEDIINGIMFKSFTLEDDFNLDEEKLKELKTIRQAVLEMVDTELDEDTVTSFVNLYLGLSYEIEDGVYLYTDEAELSQEEAIAKAIARFLEVFTSLIKHEIVDYRYDDIDYMKGKYENGTYADSLTGLEYKIRKLKEFIKDDPEALRKYELCQNKTSIKYDFFATEEELQNRLKEETEGSNPSKFYITIYRNQETNEYYDLQGRHYFSNGERDEENDVPIRYLFNIIDEVYNGGKDVYKAEKLQTEAYLFMFERLNQSDFLSCRIFIDGFLCTDYVQRAYDYQDFIYIPKQDIPVGSFVEIETFPAYAEQDIITFADENDSVIVSYHEDEYIKPTLSDLYFKNPNTQDYYSKDDFKLEYILEECNYYLDTENKITVYSPITKKDYYHGVFIDITNEHQYVVCEKYVMEDEETQTMKRVVVYLHYDSGGNYIETLHEEELPSVLSRKYFVSEKYLNSTTGEYYAEDYTYTSFYHYDNNGNLLEEKGYTRDEVRNIASIQSLTLELGDIYQLQFGDGYYTSDGKHFTVNGQRDYENDITKEELTRLINNFKTGITDDDDVMVTEIKVYPTGDLLDIIRNYEYVSQGKVYEGGTTLHGDNTKMILTPMKKVRITCLNPELYGKEIEVSIRKDSIFQYETMTRMNYPCLELGIRNQSLQVERYINPNTKDYYEKETYYSKFYHYNQNGIKDEVDSFGQYISYTRDEIYEKIKLDKLVPYIDSGSNEFVRVFRSGRICSKNRYELLLNDGESNYGYPRVQMLERIEKGETICVDVTPYRNRLVYYCRKLDPSYLVDLRGYIDKPFDIRYFEVYLNGRRISRNNIFPISPFEFKLAGIHSEYNLEIYEKDRDWEYYGCDISSYYTFSDLIDEVFMEEAIKQKVIDDITGEVPENHICEDEIEWERDLDFETVFLEIFYYNRLLPLGLANADESLFDYEDIKVNFPIVFKLFSMFEDVAITQKDYDVVIDTVFQKENTDFYNLLYRDGYSSSSIYKHKRLNGIEIVILKDNENFVLYTGSDLNSLTRRLYLSPDFIINDDDSVHFLYEKGLWIISSYDTDIYYRSEDGEEWTRDKFDFLRNSTKYTMFPYICAYMNDKYLAFGEILYDDGSDAFDSYGVIESDDGKEWSFKATLDAAYVNKGMMSYLSNSHIIYTTSARKDWYTTDGITFVEQTFDYISEQIGINNFKKNDYAVITPTIKEANGIYYAGKDTYNSSYFNCAIYSKDGINWKHFETGINISEISYVNKAWMLKKQGTEITEMKYHMMTSLDGIHFIDVDSGKAFGLVSIFESEKGFHVVNLNDFTDINLLLTKMYTKDTGEVQKVKNNVLLLDPDIYYDGDDNDRWNVYFTGNDDNFMDKYITNHKND